MTDKKESILNIALELFANEGYNVVSTNKIAKQAGVSEGLIFKHFENKKGLLDALIKDAELKASYLFAPIIFETDPKEVIKKAIELPFSISKSEYDFWKLQMKLKWEKDYNKPNKMKPLLDKLTWAFAELSFQNPAHEAQLLSYILDSISITILRDNTNISKDFIKFLLEKYKL